MKARLLRSIAAAAVGLAVILPATTQPAQAQADNDAYADITVDVLVSLLDKWADGGLSPAEIAQLVQETIAAVNGIKIDVVSRLDAQLVNELKAKVQFATTSVHYLNHPAFVGLYTIRVNEAAHMAKAHVDTVSSDHDLDAVGRAMIALFTVLEVAEARQGLLQPSRFADYRQGLQRLVDKMAPRCAHGGLPNAGIYRYTCTFNGQTVEAIQVYGPNGLETSYNGAPYITGPLNEGVVEDMAMYDSAERLAKDALETLRQRGH